MSSVTVRTKLSVILPAADNIQQCLEQAKDCAEAAACSRSQYLDYLSLERRWVKLALSYSVAARVEAYCKTNRALRGVPKDG
jgi:hypothetical protein